jgi:hypothetical protein
MTEQEARELRPAQVVPVPQYTCDVRDGHPDEQPADWLLIGESGDYALCDAHFQRAEFKANWEPIL